MSDVTEPKRRRPSPRTLVKLALAAVVVTAFVAVVSNLTGGSAKSSNALPVSSLVGKRVVSYSLVGLNGGTEEAPWASGHPAVLIFFASWCGPCHSEMPKVANYVSTHAQGNVVVMGIDATDVRSSAQAFIRRDHVTFPVAFDPNNAVTTGIFKFGQLPETVFVNASGIVKQVYFGAISTGQLSAGITALRRA